VVNVSQNAKESNLSLSIDISFGAVCFSALHDCQGQCKACLVYKETAYRFWRGNQEERDHLEYVGLTWSIILKWVLKGIRWDGVDWVYVGHGRLQLAGCCEHGNELLGSIKCGDFYDCVRN